MARALYDVTIRLPGGRTVTWQRLAESSHAALLSAGKAVRSEYGPGARVLKVRRSARQPSRII